jgi:UDP-N-acetylmuramoyl-L-alanyl-D-glutamate--2,6-diaminopimelate ligase
MQTLATLLHHLPDLQQYTGTPAATVLIGDVCFDSRKVTPTTLFVAWLGRNADTHRYIPQALANGAAALIGTKSVAELAAAGLQLPATVPYIQVGDSRRALAICAAALHDFPSRALTVIGVTGTDGKTTTCALLEAILTAHTTTPAIPDGQVGVITTVGARIRGLESDTGFHVTTPDAPDVQRFLAQMRAAACTHAIVETTSHGLAQARVAAVDYDIAAVTNITHEHLDEHGTRDAYVAAKALLFRALYSAPPKAGVPRCAVLNADDIGAETGSFAALRRVLAEEAARHAQPVPIRTYGLADFVRDEPQLPDLYASDLDYAPASTRLSVHWWGGAFPLTTALIGDFNVYNVLCAVTVALTLGVPVATIQQAVANFHGVLGRMERMDRGQPFLAVVDFAHSPVSLERALMTLRKLVGQRPDGQPGRLIAVFGSAGLRDRAKRRLMGQVSGRLADFTVITAEDPRTEVLDEINAAIAAGVEEFATPEQYTIVPDRSAAIQYAIDRAQPGDVVGAFGKGHERSMCFGETEYPWSDQAAMLSALEQRPR